MLTTDTHQCPICDGTINCEDYVVDAAEDRIRTMFVCNFCKIGWEIEDYPKERERFSLDYHAKTEPENYERFLARLMEARVA